MRSIISTFFVMMAFGPHGTYASPREGMDVLKSMAGCYLVDYSYTETESLKAGYTIDRRVYDVNKDKSIKEWITFEETGRDKGRLQHILFGVDQDGKLMEGSMLKHQAEDWEYEPAYVYYFEGPSTFKVHRPAAQGQWVRRITNLDDGLRHQCVAGWIKKGDYSEWQCENYSPIPGRESRDMGRKDYNTMIRNTRLVAYGKSWLERQDNIKIIHSGETKTQLAKETGKNWYVRLPNKECQPAIQYEQERRQIWAILRGVWEGVLDGKTDFVEVTPAGAPPRFAKMFEIDDKYVTLNLRDAQVRTALENEYRATISTYRQRP